MKQPLGKCAHCGKRKKLPKNFPVSRQHYVEDPYCSRPCLEADLGIEHKSGQSAVYAGIES